MRGRLRGVDLVRGGVFFSSTLLSATNRTHVHARCCYILDHVGMETLWQGMKIFRGVFWWGCESCWKLTASFCRDARLIDRGVGYGWVSEFKISSYQTLHILCRVSRNAQSTTDNTTRGWHATRAICPPTVLYATLARLTH
jgi:hypothetical protein